MTEMHKQIDLWNKSRKRCQKGSIPHLEMGAFLGLTSIKNAFKNQWMSKIAPDGTKMWPNDRPNDAKVDQIAYDLSMTLRLHISSHDAKAQPRFFVLENKPRDDSMERALPGGKYAGFGADS